MRVQDRFLRVSFVSYSNPSTETKRDFGSTDFSLWLLNLAEH